MFQNIPQNFIITRLTLLQSGRDYDKVQNYMPLMSIEQVFNILKQSLIFQVNRTECSEKAKWQLYPSSPLVKLR